VKIPIFSVGVAAVGAYAFTAVGHALHMNTVDYIAMGVFGAIVGSFMAEAMGFMSVLMRAAAGIQVLRMPRPPKE
jgi:hypothetical protein